MQNWELLVLYLWCPKHFGDVKLSRGKERRMWERVHDKCVFEFDADSL